MIACYLVCHVFVGFVRSLCVADFSERLETELLSAQEQSIGLSSVVKCCHVISQYYVKLVHFF